MLGWRMVHLKEGGSLGGRWDGRSVGGVALGEDWVMYCLGKDVKVLGSRFEI